MEMRRDTEWELLEWRKVLFELRKKYRDTPPGFRDSREEEACLAEISRAQEEYQKKREHRLEVNWRPQEELFAGREEYLERIVESFRAGKSPAVLYGIGGIGKTAIARAYAFRHREEYDAAVFLSCDSDFQTLFGDDVRLPVSNLRYSQDKYGGKSRYVREKLRILAEIGKKQRMLLILDDCNIEKDRHMNRVFSLPCHILITTRRDPKAWGIETCGISVGELRQGEWQEFVRLYWGKEPGQEDWKELARYWEQVGGHTLLMMLRLRGMETGADHPDVPEDFAEDLFCRFPLKKQEKQILRELSLMPVQGIRESLYFRVSGAGSQALKRLESCLLVSRERTEEGDDSLLSLHPVIAEAAGRAFSPTQSNCRRILHGFYEIARNSWNCTYLENQQIEPYVFAIFQAFPQPEAWLAREFDALSTWLWVQGYFKEAKAECRKLTASVERYYGDCHQITGEIYLRMAAACYNAMDFEESERWYWKGFECLNRCRPFNDTYYHSRSTACAKISRIYRYRDGEENLKKALELIRKALEYEKRYWDFCEKNSIWHEENDPENTYRHWQLNEARILFDMGKTREALALGKEARAGVLREIDEGKNYRYELNEFDRFLIKAMTAQGEFPAAVALAEQVVETARLYRNEQSKEMVSSQEQLADVWLASGRPEEAARLYGQILDRLEEDFPYQKKWIGKIREKWRQATGGWKMVKTYLVDREIGER